MSDPLATALARLAPHVDLGASRELFERARDGGTESEPPSPRTQRWMLAAACVVLLVAGVAGVWAIAGRDEPVPGATSNPSMPGDGTEFEVIAVEPVAESDARSIRAAGTYDDLVSIVSRFGPAFAPLAADVEFETHVAVVLERIGGFSPDELDRFDLRGDEWVAAWREPGGDTEDVGIGYAYLVAVERSALSGIDWFVLPAEQLGSTILDEQRVAVPRRVVTDATGSEFRLVAREPVGDPDRRSISVASTDEDLSALLAGYSDGFDRFAGDVNLDRELAVVIEQPANACPPDIARFLPNDREWRVQWEPSGEQACEDIGLGWVYLVAIERSALRDVATILLPAAPETEAGEIGAAVRDASIGPIVTAFRRGVPAEQSVSVFDDQAAWNEFAEAEFDASPEAAVDLDRYVVVVLGVGRDEADCFGGFDRFDVDDDVWTAMFLEVDGSCDAGLITMTQAVAVERSALPDRVTFALAADDERRLPAASVTVDVARPADSRAAFDVVSSGSWDGEPGLIGVATSRPTLQAIWTQFGIPDDMPAVDFARDVAFAFTVDDESCRAVFDGFDRGPGTPYPTWLVRLDGPESTCDPMVTTLHVVTVRREAIDGGVVFALPFAKRYGPEEARVAVDPAYSIVATTWSCGQFGITLDLPADAGVRVEVVDADTVTARGTLSGAEAGTFGIEFGMDGQPSASWEAIVTDVVTGSEVARTPLAHLPIPDCG